MKKHIQEAYDKAVLINGRGYCLEFYSSLQRQPVRLYYNIEYAVSEGLKYIDNDDMEILKERMAQDGRAFGIGLLVLESDFENNVPPRLLPAYLYENEASRAKLGFERQGDIVTYKSGDKQYQLQSYEFEQQRHESRVWRQRHQELLDEAMKPAEKGELKIVSR